MTKTFGPFPGVFCLMILILTLILQGCSSSRSIVETEKISVNKNLRKAVIKQAKSYLGTPYRWGGESGSGMDCSGLIYRSFKDLNQQVGRTTSALMRLGRRVSLKRLKPGDLLFFKTVKSKDKATHVGLVTQMAKNSTQFIHSGSSTGVTIAKLQDPYWQKRFVFARRLR